MRVLFFAAIICVDISFIYVNCCAFRLFVCSFYAFHFHLLFGAVDTHWLRLQVIRKKNTATEWKFYTAATTVSSAMDIFHFILFHMHNTESQSALCRRSNLEREIHTEHSMVIMDRLACNISIDHYENWLYWRARAWFRAYRLDSRLRDLKLWWAVCAWCWPRSIRSYCAYTPYLFDGVRYCLPCIN